MELQETDKGAQTLLIYLRTGTSSGLSRIWQWALGFQNMQKIARLVEDGDSAPWIIQTIPAIKSPNVCCVCCSTHLFHWQWLTVAQLFSRLLHKYTMSNNYVKTLNTLYLHANLPNGILTKYSTMEHLHMNYNIIWKPV